MKIWIECKRFRETVEKNVSAYRWRKERITSSPDVFSGEPVFHGTRIPLEHVAALFRKNVSEEDIAEDFPALDAGAPDQHVWNYALEHDFTVVTTNSRDLMRLLNAEVHPGLALRNRKFFSLPELNQAIRELLVRLNNDAGQACPVVASSSAWMCACFFLAQAFRQRPTDPGRQRPLQILVNRAQPHSATACNLALPQPQLKTQPPHLFDSPHGLSPGRYRALLD
jgi:uncharacterized protein (DUF433 family)